LSATERKWNFGIGAFGVVLALFAIFYWIPVDVESGIVEKERRDVFIGDGMAPFFLACCFGVLGLAMLIGSLLPQRVPQDAADAKFDDNDQTLNLDIPGALSPSNLAYLLRVLMIVAVSLTLMVWVGPLSAKFMNLLGFDVGTYRQLTNTFPYKYVGFVSGGFCLVFALITLIEGRPTLISCCCHPTEVNRGVS